jgi:hypothetical protein
MRLRGVRRREPVESGSKRSVAARSISRLKPGALTKNGYKKSTYPTKGRRTPLYTNIKPIFMRYFQNVITAQQEGQGFLQNFFQKIITAFIDKRKTSVTPGGLNHFV